MRVLSLSYLCILTLDRPPSQRTAPFLATPPSFMVSGVFPALYVLMQALVEVLPAVPDMALNTELPLSAFDGISRAYLLCNLVTPVVLSNPRPEVAASPWALLVASLVRAPLCFSYLCAGIVYVY